MQALDIYGASRGVSLRLYREEGVSAKDTERPPFSACWPMCARVAWRPWWSRSSTGSAARCTICSTSWRYSRRALGQVHLAAGQHRHVRPGRFMLHILGTIAELERGILAERVAEDMKLRAQRDKWNGGWLRSPATCAPGNTEQPADLPTPTAVPTPVAPTRAPKVATPEQPLSQRCLARAAILRQISVD